MMQRQADPSSKNRYQRLRRLLSIHIGGVHLPTQNRFFSVKPVQYRVHLYATHCITLNKLGHAQRGGITRIFNRVYNQKIPTNLISTILSGCIYFCDKSHQPNKTGINPFFHNNFYICVTNQLKHLTGMLHLSIHRHSL